MTFILSPAFHCPPQPQQSRARPAIGRTGYKQEAHYNLVYDGSTGISLGVFGGGPGDARVAEGGCLGLPGQMCDIKCHSAIVASTGGAGGSTRGSGGAGGRAGLDGGSQ